MPETLSKLYQDSTGIPATHSGGQYSHQFIMRSGRTKWNEPRIGPEGTPRYQCPLTGEGSKVKTVGSDGDLSGAIRSSYVFFSTPSMGEFYLFDDNVNTFEISREKGVDLAWYFQALAFSSDEAAGKVTAAKYILYGVLSLLATKNYDLLAKILTQPETQSMKTASLLTLARAAYAGRDFLLSWSDFIEKSRETLDSRGLEGATLLRGLT